jgi:site-specific recombinase XerC
MHRELAGFLEYCRVERRLAPLTCSAYQRDVGTCIAFLEREGIGTVTDVRSMHLRGRSDEARDVSQSLTRLWDLVVGPCR